MTGHNGVLEQIDKVIASDDTPDWARVFLLAWRDDHEDLCRHLQWHAAQRLVLEKVMVGVLTALAVAVVGWLLAGRLPGIFA